MQQFIGILTAIALFVTASGCQTTAEQKLAAIKSQPAINLTSSLPAAFSTKASPPNLQARSTSQNIATPVEQVSFEASAKPTDLTNENQGAFAAKAMPAKAANLYYEDFNTPAQQDGPQNAQTLNLQELLQSVADCFPEIEIAINEIDAADGKVLASWGSFDRTLSAHSIAQPLGFYQTYRNGAGLDQPLFSGGSVYGTYRIGDGDFEPWFGERETNEGGEFKAGFSLPLAKDRNIDARRAKLYASGFQRDQVQSNIGGRLLQLQRIASQAYWDWVASGQSVQIQQRLLDLAVERTQQILDRIEAEDLAKIAKIDNDRFIAKRKNNLIKARRLLEKASIKLSLFYRDNECVPQIPDAKQLPQEFPPSKEILDAQLQSDIAKALVIRPEIAELAALRNEANIQLQYAQNLTLPKVDLKGFAGQDIGGAASSKGDKTPFELQVGVLAAVPIQRREGQGKIQAAQAKLAQIEAKLKLTSDKIGIEIRDAASAVNAAHNQILQSTENLRLTKESLGLGKEAFTEGEISLIELNIYETSVADAELELLDAQFKYFFYRAIYKTAIRREAFVKE